MDLPALQDREAVVVQSPVVYVKSLPFNAFLTTRRVVLKSLQDPPMQDKDLALDRIEGTESSLNGAGEPVLAILATTSRGESRRLVLTFAGKPGNRSRRNELEEWIRHIPVRSGSRESGPAGNAPAPRSRAGAPGKLAFSPGICDMSSSRVVSRTGSTTIVIRDGVPGERPPSPPPPGGVASMVRDRPVPHETPGTGQTRRLPVAAERSAPVDSVKVLPEDHSFFCTKCGNRVPPGSRYCDRCGFVVVPPSPISPPRSGAPSAQYRDSAVSPRPAGDPGLNGTTPAPPVSAPAQGGQGVLAGGRFSGVPGPEEHRACPLQAPGTGSRFPAPIYREDPGRDRFPGIPGAGTAVCEGPLPRHSLRHPGLARALAVVVVVSVIIGVLVVVALPAGSPGTFASLLPAASSAGDRNTSAIPATEVGNSQEAPVAGAGTSGVREISAVSSGGISLKVDYPGTWSGSLGMPDALQPVSETGRKIFLIENAGDSVTASITKSDSTTGNLVVELYRDGEMIATGHTTKPGGQVTVTGSI